MSFFNELKRRNVVRVAIAYLVVAWVLLQGVDFVLDIISVPNWVMQVFVLAAAVGLPIVILFSWLFEITPDGIKLESEFDHSTPVAQAAGHKLDRTIIIFLVLAVALLLVNRNLGTGELFSSSEKVATTQSSDASKQDQRVEASSKGATTQESHSRKQVPPGDQRTSAQVPESERSVAVLPFANMTSDPEQEYFSDGLAEELLNKLAQYPQLRVAARTSSFQFKGKNEDISKIAEQLNVAYVLEGSVRKSGERIRIAAQLIKADDGFHVWSQTFERKMDDIFAIQDDISSAIISELEIEFGAVPQQSVQRPTESLEAYKLYLQARYFRAKRGGDNLYHAIDLFKQALAIDPNFANAWSGLAFTYGLLPLYSSLDRTDELTPAAQEAVSKALALDPQNADAYAALGQIQNWFTLELPDARNSFQKAMELAPNNAGITNLYGDYFVGIGDFENAEIMERRAAELDPLSAVGYKDLAYLYLIMNRLDQALVNAQIAADLSPESYYMQEKLLIALIMSGDFSAARALIEHASNELNADPGYVNAWWLLFYYYQGDRENLRLALDQQLQLATQSDVFSAHTIAAFFAMTLDGVDAALPLLEKARLANEVSLTSNPEYFYLPERISTDPKWLAFWQQTGLKEVMEMRRQFGPFDHIGYWKGPLR